MFLTWGEERADLVLSLPALFTFPLVAWGGGEESREGGKGETSRPDQQQSTTHASPFLPFFQKKNEMKLNIFFSCFRVFATWNTLLYCTHTHTHGYTSRLVLSASRTAAQDVLLLPCWLVCLFPNWGKGMEWTSKGFFSSDLIFIPWSSPVSIPFNPPSQCRGGGGELGTSFVSWFVDASHFLFTEQKTRLKRQRNNNKHVFLGYETSGLWKGIWQILFFCFCLPFSRDLSLRIIIDTLNSFVCSYLCCPPPFCYVMFT